MSIFSSLFGSKPTSQPAWKGNDLDAAGEEIKKMDFSGWLRVIKEAPSSAIAAYAASQCLGLALICKNRGDDEKYKVCLTAFCVAFTTRNDDQFNRLCIGVAAKAGLWDDIMKLVKSK